MPELQSTAVSCRKVPFSALVRGKYSAFFNEALYNHGIGAADHNQSNKKKPLDSVCCIIISYLL